LENLTIKNSCLQPLTYEKTGMSRNSADSMKCLGSTSPNHDRRKACLFRAGAGRRVTGGSAFILTPVPYEVHISGEDEQL
jgi:hypothetical protein